MLRRREKLHAVIPIAAYYCASLLTDYFIGQTIDENTYATVESERFMSLAKQQRDEMRLLPHTTTKNEYKH